MQLRLSFSNFTLPHLWISVWRGCTVGGDPQVVMCIGVGKGVRMRIQLRRELEIHLVCIQLVPGVRVAAIAIPTSVLIKAYNQLHGTD